MVCQDFWKEAIKKKKGKRKKMGIELVLLYVDPHSGLAFMQPFLTGVAI